MNEQEKLDATRTCSEVLFAALEEFAKSEATSVLVIFTDEGGDLVIMRNANDSHALGMCEFAKQRILHRIFSEP